MLYFLYSLVSCWTLVSVRICCARLTSRLTMQTVGLLVTVKGTPSTYNKDLQVRASNACNAGT
jgi:hypothetical protein